MANKNRLLLLSVGLFVVACALPALIFHDQAYVKKGHSVWSGYRSLSGLTLLGGLVFGIFRLNFTAFANLPLWFSWILFWRGKYAAAQSCSGLALIMSVETLQLVFQPYLYDESGTLQGYLVAPHFGFFCWIASMLVIYFSSRRGERLIRESAGSTAPLEDRG